MNGSRPSPPLAMLPGEFNKHETRDAGACTRAEIVPMFRDGKRGPGHTASRVRITRTCLRPAVGCQCCPTHEALKNLSRPLHYGSGRRRLLPLCPLGQMKKAAGPRPCSTWAFVRQQWPCRLSPEFERLDPAQARSRALRRRRQGVGQRRRARRTRSDAVEPFPPGPSFENSAENPARRPVISANARNRADGACRACRPCARAPDRGTSAELSAVCCRCGRAGGLCPWLCPAPSDSLTRRLWTERMDSGVQIPLPPPARLCAQQPRCMTKDWQKIHPRAHQRQGPTHAGLGAHSAFGDSRPGLSVTAGTILKKNPSSRPWSLPSQST